jgi:GNAT superfamily N-acetyltransferase
MSQPLQIVPCARTPREVSRFLNVSYDIYRNDPHWVAPLLLDLKKVFTNANPLFQHAEMQLWIARRDGRDVGRIAGIVDQHHNQMHQGNTVFFGFFECENNAETNRQLFGAVRAWARQKGMHRLLGPMNPTTNDECGLLVDGFDSPPQLMMTYNPRYYVELLAAEGFVKAKDLLAYHINVAGIPRERLERIAAKTRRRHPQLQFTAVRKQTLTAALVKIKEVYNAAWEKNWGFIPMTDEEIDFLAARLKPLLMEGLVWIAEAAGEPVGFMLTLPDYNEALKPLRGHLVTPKILSALPYVLGRKVPTSCRVVTLGVKAEYRNRGVEAVMLAEALMTSLRLGFKSAEASWILEDNVMMRRLLEPFGGRVYKTYRIYERAV